MLRDADMAMYRAKEKGPARHEIFSAHMHEQALQRLQMETDLRRSLEDGDFRVHYQPIVALDTGQLSGFEALVRWHHPRRGLVAPAEFLGVAEETGLIAPLGWWVLRHACVQLRAWMDSVQNSSQLMGRPLINGSLLNGLAHNGSVADPVVDEAALQNLTINVNLSARQFASDDLTERVCQVLADAKLSPRNLKLEITESTLITQGAVAARQLQALNELGVQLSLDDFGTGYSSLSYLHRYPIGSLKIDRSFISGLDAGSPGESHDASIISTIISLARQMNMSVVAEGVETPEQAGRLREMNCQMGQGFYFSQPMPHEAAALFMNEGGAAPDLPILER
jgi:EAL domain-containing protein (putative c-di-GMP-specific phosphodiesterase class I)